LPYQSLPEFIEGGPGRLIGQRRGRGTTQDDHIDRRQFGANGAEALANQTLESMALHGQSRTLFGYGESHPRALVEGGGRGSRSGEQRERAV
jgi:hypothetical protein